MQGAKASTWPSSPAGSAEVGEAPTLLASVEVTSRPEARSGQGRLLLAGLAIIAALALAIGGGLYVSRRGGEPTVVTHGPAPTPLPVETSTPLATGTSTPSATRAIVETPASHTPLPTKTPTAVPTHTPTPTSSHTPVPTPRMGQPQVVVDGTYNLRAGPGTNYGVVGQVQEGQTLDIVA